MTQAASAVALVSGGLDSAVAAAWTQSRGRVVHGVSFDYGQRHRAELAAAARVASALALASHRVVRVDLAAIGGSALTADIAVPKGRAAAEIGRGVPVTYVPARNTVFLSLALALAEVLGAEEIVIGANAVDYSGYPDCRAPYLRAFEAMANLATASATTEMGALANDATAAAGGRPRYRIVAPLIAMSKAEIVKLGVELGAPLAATRSCYDPVGPDALACGACDSCVLRRRGFVEAGVADPTPYAEAPR